jgi:hypothetical protein
MFSFLLPSLSAILALALAHPFPLHSRFHNDSTSNDPVSFAPAGPGPASSDFSSNCFPSIGFEMPSNIPNSAEGWWCSPATEYAFVGFSYEVTTCACVICNKSVPHSLTLPAGQSLQQLKNEFADIRNRFHSRYVRLYGVCDRDGFYDDVIEAAWDSTLGVHALIWVSLHARCTPSCPYF